MGFSNGISGLLSLIRSYPDRPVSERASISDYHYRIYARKLNGFPGKSMAGAGGNRAIARICSDVSSQWCFLRPSAMGERREIGRISRNWALFTVIAGAIASRRVHRSSTCRVSHSRVGSQHGCAGVISLPLEIQQIIRHELV